MATLIGDYASEPSRFHSHTHTHTMIATPGLQYNHQHHQHHQQQSSEPPHYRSTSRSREAPSRQQSSSSPSSRTLSQRSSVQQTPSSSASSTSTSRYSTAPQIHSGSSKESAIAASADKHPTSSSGGASRFPSPPDSSSPSGSAASASRSEEDLAQSQSQSQHGSRSAYMDSSAHDFAQEASSSASTQSTVIAPPPSSSTTASTSRGSQAIPSPASDAGAPWSATSHNDLSSSSPQPQTQTTIHVRDLAHIQSLARADLLSGNGPGILNDPPLQAMKYEISGMPISDIIEMVAALLTKITTTNDLQHDALNRNANHVKQAQAQNEGSAGENHMSPMSSSVLAFHGKNVPAITILSYLSRIHKYCPTTYEVFLSLLVYFDRMTERVNDLVMKAEEARRSGQTAAPGSEPPPQVDVVMRDEGSNGEDETDEDLADDSDDEDVGSAPKAANESHNNGAAASEAARSTSAPINQQATFFVVDSFNIHRLIIAGVTCASKFFSDVFYTNSRYAKVGGLPLAELNHLELQFLLLNDFRLAVPVEDLEAYATMLVEFYAREVVAQRSRPVVSMD